MDHADAVGFGKGELLDLSKCLVIGISTRSLFDLEEENEVYEKEGVEAYCRYQLEHEDVLLQPGTAFPLIKALLGLNRYSRDERLVEVIIMSRNSPDTSIRVFNAVKHYGLDISRAAFTAGKSLSPYLEAFNVDLFLSKAGNDVQAAIDAGFAAAQVYNPPRSFDPESDQIRIAFDADAVIFSEDSEYIYKAQGLDAFHRNEHEKARDPLREGPFAKLLKALTFLQSHIKEDPSPVRIAIVTARSSPAHERIVRTLRAWGVRVDEAFFLGGVSKERILKAYKALIFFDDQEVHLHTASQVVPSGKVPYPSSSPIHELVKKVVDSSGSDS